MSAVSVLAALPEDHFQCSICLNVFTDPVTTPCGHNFCKTCLSQHWDNSELCHCPVCNKRFYVKPECSTNTVIAEISAQIKRRKVETLENADAPWKVKCDVCRELKLKALKSCLVCLTSYCEAHLEPHLTAPPLMRHKLIEPVENLDKRMCKKHEKILEFFCRDEQVCICLLCCETDHKDHKTVPVEDEAPLQKENIESKKATVKLMIEDRMKKIEEFKYSSAMCKDKTDKEIESSDALFSSLMNKVEDMQTKLKSNINEKLRKSQEKDEAIIRELHEEITQLQRKHSELEELSQNEDHLQLLQALSSISDTKRWSTIKVYSDLCVHTLRRAVSHLVHAFKAELKTLTEIELTKIRQYKESISFNPSTAGSNLVVIEYGSRLKYYGNASPSSSDDSDRFSYPMAFGKKGFTSGRHYWEVQVGLRTNWDVGVAKATVDRSGRAALTKKNGFFAIGKRWRAYLAHCNESKELHLHPRPRYIGVYLDYDGGRVSFFDVSEKLHIFSFTGESFTHKLFPYFYLYSKAKKPESLHICHIWGPELSSVSLIPSNKPNNNQTV
ncbi:E3 ubiquitin-protein ligase TRIM39-like isoform X2 [Stegastes partitus]|uniref:E3 ubiquitin-protein ligase TRIM39-like isoform X2 n=1 Tax=Stegastes partitus TaxID=144197 RepID=A0A9Y4JW03_9TELE|nr:PREDICTED: E3 ubiquitin-protein ligase TRIM39-like isoform X2 [Stegastes partitus]